MDFFKRGASVFGFVILLGSAAVGQNHADLSLAIARKAYDASLAGNDVEARRLLEDPNAAFNRVAVYNLATMLSNGEGGPVDKARAFALFEKAAKAGVPEAMHNLAVY
jgi:TPR repeat protein